MLSGHQAAENTCPLAYEDYQIIPIVYEDQISLLNCIRL